MASKEKTVKIKEAAPKVAASKAAAPKASVPKVAAKISTTQRPIAPGMTIALNDRLYRIEACSKVTVLKGAPFLKVQLRDLANQQLSERNFKPDQLVEDVALIERKLEFLYPEGKSYLFLDIYSLDQVLVPATVIGEQVHYLKEGVELKGSFYGDALFSVELPQFLELMVSKVEQRASKAGTRAATLETGAKVEVPPFVEVGDIIKVDTKTKEYVQRV